jgi:transcriptional regulator with XRE-family HTH domain
MSPLKKARLRMNLSQSEIAEMVDVNQSTYQRWENSNKIPTGKLPILAKILRITVNKLVDADADNFYFIQSDDGRLQRNYFGELAVHFKSKTSLLFSISVEQRNSFFKNFFGDSPIIPVSGMNNRSYLISRDSILDVYASDDASDSFGPEKYVQDGVGLSSFNDLEWSLIEQCDHGEFIDIPEGLSLEQSARLIALCGLQPSDYEDVFPEGFDFSAAESITKLTNEELTSILSIARQVKWELSDGTVRQSGYGESEALRGIIRFFEMDGDADDEGIYLDFNASAFSVAIRASSMNYLSVPSHALDNATLEMREEELDQDD